MEVSFSNAIFASCMCITKDIRCLLWAACQTVEDKIKPNLCRVFVGTEVEVNEETVS